MPNDTYHINASGTSFVHVGGNYQSENSRVARLINYLLPTWQSVPSLELYWDHNRARQKHVGNTGEWIYEPDEFQSWLFEPNSVLWLHGIAGGGKTVLSSTVIDYLQNSLPRGSNYTAGYYFNAREDQKRNVARLVRSLLLQLLPAEGDLSPQVEKLCNNPLQNSSDDQLLLALGELVNREGHTYIVIDALDECDASFRSGEASEVEKLYDFLLWLFKRLGNLHLLVTSRDGGLASPLEQWLRSMVQNAPSKGLPHYGIDLQSRELEAKIKHDISELVTSELKRWNDHKGRRLWLPLNRDRQNLVTDAIQGRAKGMFRLAACLLDLLWNKGSWEDLELALDALPSKLYEVYDRIFQDIDSQGQLKVANILLKWLLYSERPLSLEELTEVTMVDTEGASFSIERRAEDESYVPLTLSSFVTISQGNLVQFAHQTVQEYLVSDKTQYSLFSPKVECHTWIARCCLAYMQFCAHHPEPEEVSSQIFVKQLSLFEYASNNWYRHALRAWTNPGKDVGPDGQVSSSSATACLRDCPLSISSQVPECEDARGLLSQWAAAVKLWLDQIACCHDAPHPSTLRDVACRGYEKFMKVLLAGHAPTAITRYRIELLFKVAVVGRYEEMIQIALGDHQRSKRDETCWWAAQDDFLAESQILKHESHEAIVQVLLDHGYDANYRDPEDGWTALHTAAFQGDERIMELLLRYDADTSITDYNGRTALHVAASRGHDTIIQWLLKEGLSLDAIDNLGWTALDRAMYRAATELAFQLLSVSIAERGNSTHPELIRPLLDAEYGGRLAIPEVLQSNNETTARTIRLLLDAGADNKAKDTKTPQSIPWEPTESARSQSIQIETMDEERLIDVAAPSTANKETLFKGVNSQIIIRGGYNRIGVSLMEDLLQGGQLAKLLFAPLAGSLQLRRQPKDSTTTHVQEVKIYNGITDFMRSRIRILTLYEGAANFVMSYVDTLELYGCAANFTMSCADSVTLVRGAAIFSSTAKLNNLWVHRGSVTFSKESHIGKLNVRRGSITFSEESHTKSLVVLGGSVTFSEESHTKSLAVFGGSITFSKESHIGNLNVDGGSVTFSKESHIGNLNVNGGSVTFSKESHITNVRVNGGQINFLSAADIGDMMVDGGSLHFIHDIYSEILRVLLSDGGGTGGVGEMDADTGTTTTTVRIQNLTTYAGFFNLSSQYKVKRWLDRGGFQNINTDRLMCSLVDCGQDALARLLLDEGADPSQIWPEPRKLLVAGGREMETFGWTALHQAAFRGQEAFIQMLLEKKADLHIRDGNGLTALEIAALQGHKAIVRILEEEGIQAHERDRVWWEQQSMLRKCAQGIHNVFRFLTG